MLYRSVVHVHSDMYMKMLSKCLAIMITNYIFMLLMKVILNFYLLLPVVVYFFQIARIHYIRVSRCGLPSFLSFFLFFLF